jgi:hypothetical protein
VARRRRREGGSSHRGMPALRSTFLVAPSASTSFRVADVSGYRKSKPSWVCMRTMDPLAS